jgi:dihydrofolate reductase
MSAATSPVVVDITMSLDGYVTAPGADLAHGLGLDGLVLHNWVMEGNDADRAVLEESYARTGAVIQGRRLFDFVDGPNGWNEEMGYGAKPHGETIPPIFVVTHEAPAKTRLGDRFHFVTDGLASAVRQAREVADGKDVVVMGGGAICGSVLAEGLADVLRLHVSPIVLGGGTPLFRDEAPRVSLELVDAISTPAAQHLTYKVVKDS